MNGIWTSFYNRNISQNHELRKINIADYHSTVGYMQVVSQ
jgi:hypothetical protein